MLNFGHITTPIRREARRQWKYSVKSKICKRKESHLLKGKIYLLIHYLKLPPVCVHQPYMALQLKGKKKRFWNASIILRLVKLVYGMGGVGKTIIMTQIYNELSEKEVFEIVIWVTVSSSFNEKELQNKIAEQLHCQLSSSADFMSRTQVLHGAFRRRRNFVIILDGIWNRVSLQNVGIPEPNRSNGFKVVWTTRFMDVCNSMESKREIKVEGLTDEEAWSLFKDKVGAEDVIMSTEIQPIAKQVAEECGRLPLV
ncbi:P-loop containing nucleoside triphosphate hydrolase protein [Dioscorea alata]|uniref:P-loop containing nucleoside triphosphate hydrolase protein n=1 Tax=Dioscorea alata TaxID=55571 RepID=A0ACB7WP12_DIOAL|nr:P-loop containing nucleoside triphosphate hydrolase protein [Dioscorea alata]